MKQRTVIFEQCRVPLLHLLQNSQDIAITFQKALLGDLRKSSNALSDQGRPVQPKSRQCKFSDGSACVKATVGQQQQVAIA
ncbi:MAG TPA: hypothetical protein VHR66_25515 [Gemmataceae bacterium]|nr:hypothetical protein [Gemmataceae bacterium]